MSLCHGEQIGINKGQAKIVFWHTMHVLPACRALSMLLEWRTACGHLSAGGC